MSHLIRIGKSWGVRIPRRIIERAGLAGCELELRVVKEGLLLAPRRTARQGWAEAFKRMHDAGDDALLLDDQEMTEFEKHSWRW